MKNIDRFADLETGYSGMLYPMEIDHMEHANVRYYSRAFNETAYFMFTFAGITPEYMRDNDCGMAAVEEHHYYRREIQPGDHVGDIPVHKVDHRLGQATRFAGQFQRRMNALVAPDLGRAARRVLRE